MYTVEQIEDAIITELEKLKSSNGVRVVKSYGHDLASADDPAQLIAWFPAIYTVYGGSTYVTHGQTQEQTMTFHVIVCDKSLRSEEDTRRGGLGNPGTYVLLEAVRSKLLMRQLSLTISPFELIEEIPVWTGKGVSIYSATYQTMQTFSAPC